MNTDLCTFYAIDIDSYQCIKCGVVIQSEDSVPIWPCRNTLQIKQQVKDNTFLKKCKNFIGALWLQIISGFRLCSDSEILSRYNICQKCEFFNRGACSHCGCPIFRDKKLLSKLSWRSSHCPIKKW
jgi:hypothetical protein